MPDGHRYRQSAVLLVATAIVVGALFRFSFHDWDQGTNQHPDELFLARVVAAIELPGSPTDYFRAGQSSLNPRNRGIDFYVYGDLPVNLVRLAAEGLQGLCGTVTGNGAGLSGPTAGLCHRQQGLPIEWTSVDSITRIGRFLSSVFSLGSVLLAGLIARRLFDDRTARLSLLLAAVSVLPIQAAHFFTADTFGTFFLLLSFYCLVRARQEAAFGWLCGALATAGAAVACRLNLLAFVVPLAVGVGAVATDHRRSKGIRWRDIVLALAVFYVSVRALMPSAFDGFVSPDGRWLEDLRTARDLLSGRIQFPPGVQWTGRTAWVFPWQNMVWWGLGLGLGLCAWLGWAFWGWRTLTIQWRAGGRHWWQRFVRSRTSADAGLAWLWVATFFAWQGGQWVASMRYFLPLYVFLTVFAAWFLLRLWDMPARSRVIVYLCRTLAALVVVSTVAWAAAFTAVYQQPNTRIAAAQWILDHIDPPATIAYENWDTPPLLGNAATQAGYRILKMELYSEDTPRKRERLLAWLDEADYIVLSSNRLSASIPRQPLRYPLTIRYYELLFSGQMDFEPVAVFASYPRLGPLVFPDQENGFRLSTSSSRIHGIPDGSIRVQLPPAEEAFSVYDHPRVVVFKKRPAYSREDVARRLSNTDLASAYHGFRPRADGETPNGYLFTAAGWRERESGGESERISVLSEDGEIQNILTWLVVSLALGWLGFPIMHLLAPGLAEQGMGLSRPLSIMVVSLAAWLAAGTGIASYSVELLTVVVTVWALIAIWAWWRNRQALAALLYSRARAWLTSELVFVVTFGGALLIRALNPDLWHPVFGGEKPMDFAYLNAVLRSDHFPPHDPWFALGFMNYYYFGLVMVATITELAVVPAAVAYNLALATWLALIAQAAFSVAHGLSAGPGTGTGSTADGVGRRHIVSGCIAALFAAVVGNLAQLLVLTGRACPVQGNDPCLFWDATRAIPAPGEPQPITEFPFFSFLYGDLHAHYLSLPFLLLIMGLSLSWMRTAPHGGPGSAGSGIPTRHWGGWMAGAAAMGAVIAVVRMTNTWDFPTALVLAFAAIGITAWRSVAVFGAKAAVAGSAISTGVLMATLVALSLPFDVWFAAGYESVELWRGTRTPVSVFLLLYGLFLFPFLLLLADHLRRVGARVLMDTAARMTVLGCFLAGLAGFLFVSMSLKTVPVLLVVVPALGALVYLWRRSELDDAMLCFAALGLLISAGVELVRIEGDIGRMNTVFKFSYQAWVLIGIPAAVLIPRIWTASRRSYNGIGLAVRASMVVVLGTGLLYPIFSVPAKLAQRFESVTGWGLNGMAYMPQAKLAMANHVLDLGKDHDAIAWIMSNVDGLPVVAEAVSDRGYTWSGRVSVYTGLPTILGWWPHQRQQKSLIPPGVINKRREDVDEMYGSGDPEVVRTVLRRYHVSYVFVGGLERASYPAAGLLVFERLRRQGELETAYRNGDTVIYRVPDPAPLASSLLQHVPDH